MVPLSPPSGRSASTTEVGRFMDRLESALAPLDRGILLAQWGVAMGRSAHPERWEMARARLLGGPELVRFADEALSRPLPRLLERRVALLRRAAEDVQVEHDTPIVRLRNDLLRRDASLRVRYRGRLLPLHRVGELLRKAEERRERQRLWEASQRSLATLEPGIRKLAELRNARAHELGFPSFVELRLSQEGVSRAQLERFIVSLKAIGRPAARRVRDDFEDAKGERGWYPWDLPRAFELRKPPAVDRYFPGRGMLSAAMGALRGWGFHPERYHLRIDRHAISAGGLCYAPTIPQDVRVVVNPQGGWVWYGILMHELGHAVHASLTRAPTHLLRGYETLPGNAGMSEGVGGLFEEISGEDAWLSTRTGLPRASIDRLIADRAVGWPDSVGYTALWVEQELELYRRPTGDLVSTFARLQRAYEGYLPTSVPASFGDGIWVQYGLYAKSYLFAWLFASQVREGMLRDIGGDTWPNPRVAPWLNRNWFRPGITQDWVAQVNETSGTPLGTGALLRRLRSFGA
ncbi:MAG: hypothetical protein KGI98_00340 [Euryarchaeota archaeon]|nr:hypothetical protein [Euryarchaeota archaeon]